MPRVIAIMNQKGGVGKTTTTLNLGAALAARGKRVLVVDLDPQANLTMGVGKRAADLSESVYELLTDPKADAAKLIVPTQWERLHLIPSHIDLSGAEIEMVTMIGRETRLSKSLDPVRAGYDYILIDCLPSLSLLTVNAMAAASEVFVPLQAHPFALEGLGKLFEVVGMIREAMNPSLKVTGVLVTMFDGRTNVSKVTLENLRRDERLREHIFSTTIKQNIKVAESQKDGVPVIYFDSNCHASKAYYALASEVLEMESGSLASLCGERITQRERAAGEKLTFTPDLLAPVSRPAGSDPAPAPAPEPHATAQPATTHAAPVTALMQGSVNPEPAAPAASPVESSAAQPESAVRHVETPAPQSEPTVPADESKKNEPLAPGPVIVNDLGARAHSVTEFRNSPDAESIHPSGGALTIPPVLIQSDVIALAQAAQSGVMPARQSELAAADPRESYSENPSLAADLSDESYRPRLALKPGSCKVPLPPLAQE